MKKYIAAVSAGPDSMALLNKYKNKIKAVCHVNYHDREDTENDEIIIRKYCKKYNLKLYIFDTKKNDISKYKLEKNLQTYYRKIRYDFFEDVARIEKCYICLIGHNKDDFIESAYMALLDNKHLTHFGIKKKSKYKNLKLYRPLLHCWKLDLEKYCRKNKIDFAVDYTNFSNMYRRNLVRKEISDWDKKKKELYFLKIKFLNFKLFFNNFKNEYIFKKWVKTNFDLTFLKKKKLATQKELMYLFFKDNNFRINKNKLLDSLQFIIKFNGNNKKYRLKNNIYLNIKNKKIVIEANNEK